MYNILVFLVLPEHLQTGWKHGLQYPRHTEAGQMTQSESSHPQFNLCVLARIQVTAIWGPQQPQPLQPLKTECCLHVYDSSLNTTRLLHCIPSWCLGNHAIQVISPSSGQSCRLCSFARLGFRAITLSTYGCSNTACRGVGHVYIPL